MIFSSFSGLTWRFLSLRPNHGLFFGVMQTSFSHARIQRAKNGLSDPTFSSFPGLARHFLSPRPDHDLFLALCKLLFLMLGSSAWKMGSRTRLFPFFGSSAWKMGSQTRLFFLPKSSARKSGSQPQLFLPPRIQRTKISHTARPKLVFRHYVNLFSRATHYNVPNEYPCVCAASIRSPSTAAFVADSACSR